MLMDLVFACPKRESYSASGEHMLPMQLVLPSDFHVIILNCFEKNIFAKEIRFLDLLLQR